MVVEVGVDSGMVVAGVGRVVVVGRRKGGSWWHCLALLTVVVDVDVTRC